MSRDPFMFVFGPDGSFFFDSPLVWKWHNIHPEFRDCLRSEVKEAVIVTMDDNTTALFGTGKGDELFIRVFYRIDKAEFDKKEAEQENNPEEKIWSHADFVEGTEDFDTYSIAVGAAGDVYWAHASHGYIWNNIPKTLERQFQKDISPSGWKTGHPVSISFGYGNSWFMRRSDGSSEWQLNSHYDTLDGKLKDRKNGIPRVRNMTLNPWKAEEYFVIFDDDSVAWSLPQEWAGYINEVLEIHKKDQQQKFGKAIIAISTQALERSVQALTVSDQALARSSQALNASNQAMATSSEALQASNQALLDSTSQQSVTSYRTVTNTSQSTRSMKLEQKKQILGVVSDSIGVGNGLLQLGSAASGCVIM